MRHEGSLVAGGRAAIRPIRAMPRFSRVSIAHRVFLVGAIPIAIAVVIGIATIFLLDRADDARRGALTVATVYRHVVSAMSSRDAYVEANADDRDRYFVAFSTSLARAENGLRELDRKGDGGKRAASIRSTIDSLANYRRDMTDLTMATARNDGVLADMRERLRTLIGLTDEARQRQHAANVDVVKSLTQRDATLRATQDVVDNAQMVRTTVVDTVLDRNGFAFSKDSRSSAAFAQARLQNAGKDLADALRRAGAISEAEDFANRYSLFVFGGDSRGVVAWLDRRLKIDTTAQRALHDEVAELLTYTVEAHETEQATQNIAIAVLKLGESMGRAVSHRNSAAIADVITDSRKVGDQISSLPISPLIQTEMLDALDRWREGLTATQEGLANQNEALDRMNRNAQTMVSNVSDLNNSLLGNADETGSAARRILLFGAGLGLLVAAGTGLLVARSITKPLSRLQRDMIDRAARPKSGLVANSSRRDEIGSMARATNFFLAELGKREGALRSAKERTESALQQLKKTQSELIQSEKLASLGQLVAGVAHEINTPLGVALTTATVMGDETRRFESDTQSGRVTREAFDRFVTRIKEGAQLVTANLQRSADLVHSFKQVAADQASGERRHFMMDIFVAELFTSLGPMNKRAGHAIRVECEPGIEMDSYPGSLAQVLTNLLSNSIAHAFEDGRTGTISVRIARIGEEAVRIVFADDGKGVAKADRSRIFDPFFTTGRARGSTGLGLHIVFNLVTATLGGTIDLDDEAPCGTRFVIDLPTRRPDQPATHAAVGKA